MKMLVSLPHHDYPARVRGLLEAKLRSLLKYYDRIESLRAICERQSELHRVEIVANVGHRATLVVDARADALESAIDDALAKMSRVLSTHRRKREDRRRRARR